MVATIVARGQRCGPMATETLLSDVTDGAIALQAVQSKEGDAGASE